MNYNTLKSAIQAVIKANGNNEITGPILQAQLISMITTLGAGYQMMGVAQPGTNPGTPDARVCYLAYTAGTYTNFGGIVVSGLCLLRYDSSWHKDDIPVSGGGGTDFTVETTDLTLESGTPNKLKFADRLRENNITTGKNFIIVRDDLTIAQQLNVANAIYEIRYDFDLDGSTINIPAGCTLRFNGGSISNGNIVYNNTEIQGDPIINCVCTGGLRNTIVTPQMYGAKGDNVTDDKVAFNNAVLYNDTVFVPSGTYKITEPVQLKNNNTLFGTGKESKLVNPTVQGYNKMCVWAGGLSVGQNDGSFLEITPQACTIAADKMNVLISDTSGFAVGDIVYICKDEAYTTKNPLYSWTAKIVSIEANTSLKLDGYIDPDYLDGVSCLIRNLANLPASSAYLGNKIVENVSVHDLSLINSEDSGSGMYVIGIGVYKGSFRNLFLRGNTCLGGNFAINVSIDNIVAEYDGGFIDIPEISQFVEVSNCRGTRYGARQNIIGVTFLMGYKCYFHNNIINDGNVGKIGFQQHLYPIIRNNILMNFNPGSGRAVELSVYGNSILQNNYISSNGTNAIVDARGTGNIITENYIVNPNVIRWLQGYTAFDYSNNRIEHNYTTKLARADASYMNQLVNTVIRTDVPQINGTGTITVNADTDYIIFNTTNNLNRPRLAKLTVLMELGDYTLTLTGYNNSTRTLTLTQVSRLELYIIDTSNYIRYYIDGVNGGAKTTTFNSHGTISKIVLHNTGADAKQVYLTLYEAAVS